MKLSLRFVIPLLIALGAVAYAVLPLAESLTERWFIRDLEIRATLVASTVRDQIEEIDRTDHRRDFCSFSGVLRRTSARTPWRSVGTAARIRSPPQPCRLRFGARP